MDNAERAVAANDFFMDMERQARRGEIIVKVIVISSYVLLAIDVILSFINRTFSLLSLIIWVLRAIVYYKLYTGRTWAKWLYIIVSAIGVVFSVILLVQLVEAAMLLGRADVDLSNSVAVALWLSVAITAAQTVFCVLLIRSKSVKEFLYRQMAGG